MYLFCKRAFDLLTVSVALVLLSPLFLVIALIIKLDSPGPVFYRGIRTGKNGLPFAIFKFRTMVVNAESLGGTTTGVNDHRVTRVGKIIREYKLDELPQLINVFLGDMSLVGPRPEVEEYTRLFDDREKLILSVRPGITDLSSVEFHDLQSHVGSEDPDKVFREQILPQKNALRLQYIEQRSFATDLLIIARTAQVILSKPFRSRA